MSIDEAEDRIPPKMRKKWMHRELEAFRETARVENGDKISLRTSFNSEGAVFFFVLIMLFLIISEEQRLMPPPSMPASKDPTTVSLTTVTPMVSSNNPSHQYQSPPRSVSVIPATHSPRRLSTSPQVSTSPSASSPLTSFARLSLLSPTPTSSAPMRQLQSSTTASSPPADVSITEALILKKEEQHKEEKSSFTRRSPPRNASSLPPSSLSLQSEDIRKSKDWVGSTLQTISTAPEEGKMDTNDEIEMSTRHIPSSSFQERISPPVIRTILPSRHQCEDDEVDYSPQSPETSVQDSRSPASVVVDDQSPGKLRTSAIPIAIVSGDPVTFSPQLLRNLGQRDESKSRNDIQSLPERLSSMPPDPSSISVANSIDISTATGCSEPKINSTTVEAPALLAESSPAKTSSSLASTPEPGWQASPPPPPKVKMSLKDFALRKKKQREEMMAHSQSMQASPVLASPPLPNADVHIKPPFLEAEDHRLGSDKNMNCLSGQGDVVAPRVEENNPFRNKEDARAIPGNVNGIKTDLDSIKDSSSNTVRQDIVLQKEKKVLHMSSPTSTTISVPPSVNGYPRNPPMPTCLPNKPPVSLPARPMQHILPNLTSTKNHIHETKQEHVEPNLPSLLHRVPGTERSISPISPDPTPLASRISQEEDGEIGESPLPISSRYHSLPSNRDFVQRPLSRNGLPYSHSLPTGPRNLPVSSYRSPSLPTASYTIPSVPAVSSSNASRSSLPTAPRALRQSILSHQRSGSGPPPGSPHSGSLLSSQSGLYGGSSHYIPRGPSADRDREKERADWDQRHYRGLPPPARRGGGSGRGKPWGR